MATTTAPRPPAAAVEVPAEQLPPGLRWPPLLQTLLWTVAPTWVMDRAAARCGDEFTITFGPSARKLVMISDPDAVKTVMTAPPEVAPSGTAASPIASVLGPSSVITLVGAEHMRQRRLLLPPFHGERMREYEQVIVEETRRDMASWPLGTPTQAHPRTRAITLEVILRAVFGVEVERMDPLRTAIGDLLEPMNGLGMLRFVMSSSTGPPGGKVGEALARLDGLIYEELHRRRAQTDLEQRQDILSLLLLARDEDGEPMTDQELRDELVSLLLAGHETTATSTAWAIERLVRHPAKLRRLIDELDAGEDDSYMQAVINETLRVRPVVPLVIRLLEEPLQVGERLLPRGTRVAPSVYLTNRSARVYDDPTAFRPERFLGSSPETFSWIPFGGGIRRCIGASFALLEMKLILGTILGELEPSLPQRGGRLFRNGEWNRRRAITLTPTAGARVVWRRR
ncbi:MAG TPA: cytochrome P450 [Solirubrobacteraceae bacterium]|nr:cytochrome P450 [Solirubrobacteraceae bacterium]